jgi:molybdopterin converting factor small subunit
MKVKVYAPLFGDTSKLDDNGFLELPDGAVLRDVFKLLKIPFMLRNSMVCMVNYEPCKASRELVDGDTVSFIGFVSGG